MLISPGQRKLQDLDPISEALSLFSLTPRTDLEDDLRLITVAFTLLFVPRESTTVQKGHPRLTGLEPGGGGGKLLGHLH